MKNTFWFCSFLILLASCNLNNSPKDNNSLKLDSLKISRDTTSEIKEYKGLYHKHFGQFTNCADNHTYVIKNTTVLDSLYELTLPNAYPDEAVFLTMDASIDASDPNALTYMKNAKTEQKNFKN